MNSTWIIFEKNNQSMKKISYVKCEIKQYIGNETKNDFQTYNYVNKLWI